MKFGALAIQQPVNKYLTKPVLLLHFIPSSFYQYVYSKKQYLISVTLEDSSLNSTLVLLILFNM